MSAHIARRERLGVLVTGESGDEWVIELEERLIASPGVRSLARVDHCGAVLAWLKAKPRPGGRGASTACGRLAALIRAARRAFGGHFAK
jgi:hypothetical protein